ncbi:hypothetical protein BZZ01_16245 [Nostocales cyanobacterium HT-58-2]|nr:hypothetical protein BZZ01_16245 [Nostocales cyanobacterium HT-58-2]
MAALNPTTKVRYANANVQTLRFALPKRAGDTRDRSIGDEKNCVQSQLDLLQIFLSSVDSSQRICSHLSKRLP